MLKEFHIEIMQLALGEMVSPRALRQMIDANLYLDRLRGQIGHPEYHFDHDAFEESYAFLEGQRLLTVSALVAGDAPAAWSAFGKLTHTAQDFYAHSNYIDLWLSLQPDGATPAPEDVEPLHPDLIDSPALRSGKIYLREVLTLIPLVGPLFRPLVPRDSHAWMNIDSPEHGESFPYVLQAAVKRTRIEFERTSRELPADLFSLFVDK
jgi:hypothetical protein